MILFHRSWGTPTGPVALLVHGGCNTSATWMRLGGLIGDRGWHVIAVDLRGHGQSQVPRSKAGDASFKAMATDLVDTLAALRPDADRVDVVLGHSLGTVVALVGISEHPSFARRIVLEDPPGPGLDYARMATEIQDNISAARRDPVQFARDIFVGPLGQLSDKARDAHVEGMTAADPMFVPKIVRSLAEIDVVALAARCALPALIVLGRDKGTALGDGRSPSEDLSRFSSLSGPERARFCSSFRHARVHELQSGHELHHMVFTEYVEVLADWLEDTQAIQEPKPADA